MPAYTLHCFGGRGVTEVSRQLFALSGTPYQEKRYVHDSEEWPKVKPSTPFGQLPVLEVDGKQIPQSSAIARYLAREFGFAGSTPFEEAWVDALADQFKDYLNEFRPFGALLVGFRQGDRAKLQKEIGEPARDKFYSIIENRLNDSQSGFLVGSSVTWIDLQLADHVDVILQHAPEFFNSFPKTLQQRKKIQAIPEIKEWIEKRPETKF